MVMGNWFQMKNALIHYHVSNVKVRGPRWCNRVFEWSTVYVLNLCDWFASQIVSAANDIPRVHSVLLRRGPACCGLSWFEELSSVLMDYHPLSEHSQSSQHPHLTYLIYVEMSINYLGRQSCWHQQPQSNFREKTEEDFESHRRCWLLPCSAQGPQTVRR